jgi:probable F420-dependent oxidoreductase
MHLGRVGLWTFQLDLQPASAARETAAELEALGYPTVWLPEAVGREPFVNSAMLLGATERMIVATGIASVWARDAMTMAAGHLSLNEAFGGRFLLGLGVSHQPMVDYVRGHQYEKPLTKMRGYLEAMDKAIYMAPRPADEPRRVLAALGPKMLELAAAQALGAHPYFVPVEHTAFAREVLGDGPMLCPEQAVVLDADPERARAAARLHMATYLTLPNYTNNLRRLGWGDDDLDGGGSDKLVDAIVAWGDEAAVLTRVQDHLDAGADHVCVQVLGSHATELPMEQWRRLAEPLREI